MRHGTILKFAVSIGLLGLLAFNADWPELLHTVASLPPLIAGVAVLLYYGTFGVNALKWGYLLGGFPLGRLFQFTMIGVFYTTVLPGAILGEVAKAYRVSRGSGRAEEVVASVIVDRVTGVIGVLMVTAGGLMLAGQGFAPRLLLAVAAVLVVIVVGLFALIVPLFHRLACWGVQLPARWWQQLAGPAERFVGLLAVWRSYLLRPWLLSGSIVLGVVFQLGAVAIAWLLAGAYGIDLPYADWCWIYGVVALALMLPISLGGLGLREGSFAAILQGLGYPLEQALALSLSLYALQLAGALLGAYFDLTLRRADTPPPRA